MREFADGLVELFLGNLDDARKSVTQLCKLNASLRLSNFRQTFNFRLAEDIKQLEEGLRLAGMPE